jgi:cob(I)alamin adenosyltransferase
MSHIKPQQDVSLQKQGTEMAFKIYTKTGDKGHTSLIGGTRVSKSSLRIEAYGTVDELNCYVGWAADYQQEAEVVSLIREIQDRLFTIGSSLATDPEKEVKMKLPVLEEEDISVLEKAIDGIDEKVPPLRSFILPGGDPAVSVCHVARCVCRRAERLCVAVTEQEETLHPLVIPYLNRLSDYLFMLARYTSFALGKEEIAWKARK